MASYRIGLGVSGGIAAYKAVEVMRLLQKSGCEVSVAMTRHATEFVQPLTFRALTDKHVIVDDYDPANPDPIAHINFSQNIDLLLVVPATANIIGTVNCTWPKVIVPSQLKILTPVGIAIVIVVAEKTAFAVGPRPVVNMWCAHTPKPRKAIAAVA